MGRTGGGAVRSKGCSYPKPAPRQPPVICFSSSDSSSSFLDKLSQQWRLDGHGTYGPNPAISASIVYRALRYAGCPTKLAGPHRLSHVPSSRGLLGFMRFGLGPLTGRRSSGPPRWLSPKPPNRRSPNESGNYQRASGRLSRVAGRRLMASRGNARWVPDAPS